MDKPTVVNPDAPDEVVHKMKMGMIIYSSDPETVWNPFLFLNFSL